MIKFSRRLLFTALVGSAFGIEIVGSATAQDSGAIKYRQSI